MKKQLLLLCTALLLSITLVQAQKRETRTVETFTKLAFRTPGKLLLRQGPVQKVEIEGKADIIKEIETRVEGSKLIIGKEGKWFDWGSYDDEKITVYVTVKNLDAISVSGSGTLIAETPFTTENMDLNVSGSGDLKIHVEATGNIEANVSGSGDIELRGKCKNMESDVSGSGKVDMTITIADLADYHISGSGKIVAKGTSNVVKTTVSGSGKVLAAELEANRCDIRISGSGDVEINVKNEIEANISGSGTVSYKGNPAKVNSHASGSGNVKKM
jgi:hypothetical protein